MRSNCYFKEQSNADDAVAGGKAIPVICSAEDGEKIVKAALDAYGGVHVLVANAGVLRDRSFTAMTEQEWDTVIAVHLRGTYKVCLFVCEFLESHAGHSVQKLSGQYSKNKNMVAL